MGMETMIDNKAFCRDNSHPMTPTGPPLFDAGLLRLLIHPSACRPQPANHLPHCICLSLCMQDYQVVGISLSTWRSHVLLPRRSKGVSDKPLESGLLSVTAVRIRPKISTPCRFLFS